MNKTKDSLVLSVRNLSVYYGHRLALWDVSFGVPAGKLVGVVGPNGAGKSTLLKAIMGLVDGIRGSIEVFGRPMAVVRKRVGYVPQRESLDWDFPISVQEVVCMGRYGRLGLFKRQSASDKARVGAALEEVGMARYAKRPIAALSGGQQQRVLLARAAAQEADLYLMDEPFAGIDAKTEEILFTQLERLTREGKSIMIVFHNLYTAAKHFEWLVMLNKRLIAAGPTKEIFTKTQLTNTYGGTHGLWSETLQQMTQR